MGKTNLWATAPTLECCSKLWNGRVIKKPWRWFSPPEPTTKLSVPLGSPGNHVWVSRSHGRHFTHRARRNVWSWHIYCRRDSSLKIYEAALVGFATLHCLVIRAENFLRVRGDLKCIFTLQNELPAFAVDPSHNPRIWCECCKSLVLVWDQTGAWIKWFIALICYLLPVLDINKTAGANERNFIHRMNPGTTVSGLFHMLPNSQRGW